MGGGWIVHLFCLRARDRQYQRWGRKGQATEGLNQRNRGPEANADTPFEWDPEERQKGHRGSAIERTKGGKRKEQIDPLRKPHFQEWCVIRKK